MPEQAHRCDANRILRFVLAQDRTELRQIVRPKQRRPHSGRHLRMPQIVNAELRQPRPLANRVPCLVHLIGSPQGEANTQGQLVRRDRAACRASSTVSASSLPSVRLMTEPLQRRCMTHVLRPLRRTLNPSYRGWGFNTIDRPSHDLQEAPGHHGILAPRPRTYANLRRRLCRPRNLGRHGTRNRTSVRYRRGTAANSARQMKRLVMAWRAAWRAVDKAAPRGEYTGIHNERKGMS